MKDLPCSLRAFGGGGLGLGRDWDVGEPWQCGLSFYNVAASPSFLVDAGSGIFETIKIQESERRWWCGFQCSGLCGTGESEQLPPLPAGPVVYLIVIPNKLWLDSQQSLELQSLSLSPCSFSFPLSLSFPFSSFLIPFLLQPLRLWKELYCRLKYLCPTCACW